MKILTEKQINEIISIECDIRNDIDAQTQLEENNAEIAYIVGGIKGMTKVRNTVHKRYVSNLTIM